VTVFERIILAVDGSVPAERAAATRLAAKLGSEVLVVHVLRVYYSGAAV
jgi:nucleotide-binding universal stress UspA family protein